MTSGPVIDICPWCDEPLEHGRVCRNCRLPEPVFRRLRLNRRFIGQEPVSEQGAQVAG
jgi:hypothetical protein